MRNYVEMLEIQTSQPENPNQDLIDRLDAIIANGTYGT